MDNKESNASKQSNSAESVHSAHSQDTELIYDVGLSCDNSRNTSIMTTPSNSDSLCVNSGSPQDHSLLDFISSPNHTSSTVCSTPHESKLASVSKRPCPNIFDEQSIIKKQKLFNDSLYSNVLRSQKDSIANRSMDSESSREELSSSQKRNLLPGSKLPNVEYAEASSSSSTEKVISSSSIESEEAGMLKEQRFPDYLRQRNDIRKSKKENRGKTFTEWVICSISYVYDSVSEEIKSISIKQMSKTDTYYDLKQPRLSLSSGSLADSSGSETNCISRQAHSTRASHSSTVSSSSSGPSHTDKQPVNQFLIPQIPDPKKHLNFKYPKTCVCQCYCTNFVDMHTKPRCFTPETSSSSSENIKPDSQDLTLSSVPLGDLRTNVLKKAISDSSSVETLMDDSLVFRSRSSIYIPASTNLPVFAKWPSNSYCYPGIVENATEEIWHKSSHLEVKFCDGTVRKILSENLFPAYLLRSGTEICFEKDDVCETAVLISIERLLNNELVCLGESQKGIGERVNIPFEKIFLSDYCYKELKKEIPTTITPRKTPKFSLSTDNLQEGKRTRKTVKFESLSPKQSGSTGRKTKGKYKRTRSAGSSSSETLKDTGGRKRFRSSSQKKQLSKKSEDQNSTPNVRSALKKEVSRNLYPESPGCSKTQKETESCENLKTISSSDTDSSTVRDVNIEEVSSPYLDSELIPNVTQRSTKTKSSLRKNNSGSKDDKLKGPIPEKNLFSGFNFVLTQATPKKNIQVAPKSKEFYSEEGSGTDYEDYFTCSVPFDYLRLKDQIISGGGRVFRSILQIPLEEHTQTFLITDNIVESPNYLLAVSFGIPIYRHDLIVDCCIQGKCVADMRGVGMNMPLGRSILDGSLVESKKSEKPLKGYACALYLTDNESTINFWWHVLTKAGAKIMYNQNISRLISEFEALISFIVADERSAKNLLECAKDRRIPVVTTLWVMQCIIHGKHWPYDSLPQFRITL